MTSRADKAATPPTSKPTTYEISIVTEDGRAWLPAGHIEATGALTAIRLWAEQQGDKFTGGRVRAVPRSRITIVDVKVETKRQLTLGSA